MKLDVGPGYRIYYGQVGKKEILLLCGGTKHGQDADIDRACRYFADWKEDRKETNYERSTLR